MRIPVGKAKELSHEIGASAVVIIAMDGRNREVSSYTKFPELSQELDEFCETLLDDDLEDRN